MAGPILSRILFKFVEQSHFKRRRKMDFFKSNVGKVATQVDAVLPDEKRKELIKEKLGPLVMKINPTFGAKITEELMKQDLSKLVPLVEDEKKLEKTVEEEAKKIEEQEKKEKSDLD